MRFKWDRRITAVHHLSCLFSLCIPWICKMSSLLKQQRMQYAERALHRMTIQHSVLSISEVHRQPAKYFVYFVQCHSVRDSNEKKSPLNVNFRETIYVLATHHSTQDYRLMLGKWRSDPFWSKQRRFSARNILIESCRCPTGLVSRPGQSSEHPSKSRWNSLKMCTRLEMIASYS